MAGHRTPRSTNAAMAMLERYAELEDAIAGGENIRNARIAEANKVIDESLAPMIQEREEIRAKLEPWWATAAADLTKGKRKSAELGGCIVGTVAGRESLDVDGDEDEIVQALQKRSWAAPLLRVTTKLDRKAILASIDGVYKKQLATLGLARRKGSETFYIKRAEQGRTMASAD